MTPQANDKGSDQVVDQTGDRRRLGFVLATTAAMALIVAGLSLALYDTAIYRSRAVGQTSVQAEILAASVAASLVFADPEVAQEYVNALDANPDITAAAVYDDHGTEIASYARTPEDAPPKALPATGARTVAQYVLVTQPVHQGGNTVGSVYIRAKIEPLTTRLFRYGGIALLITMGALLFAVLRNANSRLADVNARLVQEIEERERVEEALRQSQKMEAIGQLTGGIAHDFNNMLAVIIGGLQLLKRRLERGEKDLGHFVDAALDGANRAATLTQRLLAFSRQQPLRPESVDVNKLISAMSDLVRRTIGEAYSVETVLGAGLWRINADAHQLESSILNLAVNSRDAMPQGGKLTVETANTFLDPQYARDAGVPSGQYVMIALTDTGTGMSPTVMAKAFDPFFTTKSVGKGTGLGLSQVYGFVRQSGGHVKIYSEEGHGTSVKIYLPRDNGTGVAQAAPTVAPPVQGNDRITILAVEDEEAVRGLAVQSLRELGYRVLQAANAALALDVLKQHPEVTVLFTDIVMPETNGRKLAEAAMRLHPGLKVLYTTGYTRNAVVHNGVLDMDVHLLTKPFTLEQLGLALQKVLAEEPQRKSG